MLTYTPIYETYFAYFIVRSYMFWKVSCNVYRKVTNSTEMYNIASSSMPWSLCTNKNLRCIIHSDRNRPIVSLFTLYSHNTTVTLLWNILHSKIFEEYSLGIQGPVALQKITYISEKSGASVFGISLQIRTVQSSGTIINFYQNLGHLTPEQYSVIYSFQYHLIHICRKLLYIRPLR